MWPGMAPSFFKYSIKAKKLIALGWTMLLQKTPSYYNVSKRLAPSSMYEPTSRNLSWYVYIPTMQAMTLRS